MKHCKSLTALALCATLCLSLAACDDRSGDASNGSQEDPVDPLAAAQENMAAASSLEARLAMKMDLEAAGQTIESTTTMEMTYFNEPLQVKADLTIDMGTMGSTDMLLYAEAAENGSCTMYTNSGAGWTSQNAALSELEQYDARSNMALYLDSANFTQNGTGEIDGVSAYQYTGVITGSALKDVMLSSGALNSLSSLNITAGQLEEMASDLGDVSVVLWIDQENLYPIRYDMDMTAVMNSLMSKVVDSMGGQDLGLDMSISKMTITMACSNFNCAEAFTIPDEARG